jgi:farnesyl-diphosphate farnesyltransferase
VSGDSPPRASVEDRRACAAWLPRVSRTFALSIELLPDSLREAVRVAYLLCRVVDTIEDEPRLPLRSREELFDQFDQLLADVEADPSPFEERCERLGLGGEGADGELCRGAGAVFRCYRDLPDSQQRALTPSVAAMSSGMREYCRRAADEGQLRLRDLDDLERYCYFVAGTVGELLTALFEQSVPVLEAERRAAVRERAISFGLGLQLVNIVKDVATDWQRGDCFLPVELARDHGIELAQLLEPLSRDAALKLVSAVCQRAWHHLERAREYTLLWPSPQADAVRLFCTVPLALAFASLHEVERGDDTLRPGPRAEGRSSRRGGDPRSRPPRRLR